MGKGKKREGKREGESRHAGRRTDRQKDGQTVRWSGKLGGR